MYTVFKLRILLPSLYLYSLYPCDLATLSKSTAQVFANPLFHIFLFFHIKAHTIQKCREGGCCMSHGISVVFVVSVVSFLHFKTGPAERHSRSEFDMRFDSSKPLLKVIGLPLISRKSDPGRVHRIGRSIPKF